MSKVTLSGVYKRYGGVTAVTDLSLEIRDGEFMVLVGPSGCGKSTALRMIAGLEEISDGQVVIGDRVVNDIEPRDRDIAMVFQNYALYPHMSVYDNMAFGLKQRRFPKAEVQRRVDEASRQLSLEPLMSRKPGQLSGGQRQRVALGRAIVREPKVFLMDEPLSNLDAQLRVQTRGELIKLHRRLGITTIYVTHDQVEAMTMGQRIAVMRGGVLQQCDTPMALYAKPNSVFVASFIGTPSMNFVDSTLSVDSDGKYFVNAESFVVAAPPISSDTLNPYVGKKVLWGVRPADLYDGSVLNLVKAGTDNVLEAKIDVIEPMGDISMCYLTVGPHKLVASLSSETVAKETDALKVIIDTNKTHLFDPETQLAIRQTLTDSLPA